jgi:3-deoxy-D-manno-octulosonic-acid transferase/heptosyltransferase-1
LKTEKPNSILIVKLSAIGDVVHTLPLLEVLRKNFPTARIDWVVEEEAGQLIEGHEEIDHVIISRRKSWRKRLFKLGEQSAAVKEIIRFLKELRSQEYDLVIDLHGLFKSGILTGLSKGTRKIGFTGGREGSAFFLTEKPYYVNYDQHALDRYLRAADYLSLSKASWQGQIPMCPSDKKTIDSFVREYGLEDEAFLAMNPVARWETKLWEHTKFSVLGDRIQKELSHKVILTGSQQDRAFIDKIMNGMSQKPVNLAGRTSLKELAYLYSRCELLITTDTGPMHIAAAMGCPVVALFGPTAPWRTGPYGDIHRVIRDGTSCSPCFKRTCSHMTCMKNITAEKVFNAVEAFLVGRK